MHPCTCTPPWWMYLSLWHKTGHAGHVDVQWPDREPRGANQCQCQCHSTDAQRGNIEQPWPPSSIRIRRGSFRTPSTVNHRMTTTAIPLFPAHTSGYCQSQRQRSCTGRYRSQVILAARFLRLPSQSRRGISPGYKDLGHPSGSGVSGTRMSLP